jgi:AbrB family looped-hinge helix DNA binding protein
MGYAILPAMKSAITVDSAGRVVLPSEARRHLNLRPGSRLLLQVVAGRIELTPEPDAAPPAALAASRRRVLPATGTPFDAAAAVRAERAARAVPRKAR